MTTTRRLLEIKLNGKRAILADIPEEGMLNAFVALWPGIQAGYPTRITAVYRYADGSEIEKEWQPPTFLEDSELSMRIIESAEEPTPPSSTTRLTTEDVARRAEWSDKMATAAEKARKEMGLE